VGAEAAAQKCSGTGPGVADLARAAQSIVGPRHCIQPRALAVFAAPRFVMRARRHSCCMRGAPLASLPPHRTSSRQPQIHSSRCCLTDCKLSPPLRTSSLISRCPRQRPAARECACRTRPDARSHPAPPQQGGGQCHEGQGPHEAALLLPGACDRPAIIDSAASLTQSRTAMCEALPRREWLQVPH
jgi:hypothetical protein